MARILSAYSFANQEGVRHQVVEVIVAALTAFLTAITTASCLGFGPIII